MFVHDFAVFNFYKVQFYDYDIVSAAFEYFEIFNTSINYIHRNSCNPNRANEKNCSDSKKVVTK